MDVLELLTMSLPPRPALPDKDLKKAAEMLPTLPPSLGFAKEGPASVRLSSLRAKIPNSAMQGRQQQKDEHLKLTQV